ncbi:MAG: TonB-dependent receptor [Candidatus Symbiothrix sp.]|jgi:TonB-linked SusC/RagA family outer membrane protein|nr:TonB-dependent receptor [Candidatus Symbiothrix sp.]
MRNILRKTMGLSCFLLLFPLFAFAQNTTVSGVVTDEKGEKLPGVSIVVVGTTTGTVSDLNGNYHISAVPNGKLTFSFIGYQTQTVEIGNRQSISVILKEDTKLLDEVVVVGYGTMKRSDLTGSIASVSADAIAKSVPTSIDQVLQGRAAGVQVMQNSGMPGSSTSIRIRGVNSLNASNEPIYVIDGVVIDGSTESSLENPLASINPSDVVSMDILKDASATAIYGSRAANGVIIITTTRGKEGTSKITYDGYFGAQTMPKKLPLLTLQQYAYHQADRNEVMAYPLNDAFVRPDLLGKGTDWQDELFTTAMTYNHNLSISGGNAKTNYAIGAGYLDQDGIAYGSGFQRLSLRGNLDTEVKSWLKAGVNFNITNAKQVITVGQTDGNNSNLINVALFSRPNIAARNIDGTFGGPEESDANNNQPNPLGLALMKENKNERSAARSNLYLEASILKGLTLKSEFSSEIGINNTYLFTPAYKFGAIVNEVRESTRSKSYSTYWSQRNVLNYTHLFNKIQSVNLMLGQEIQSSAWEYLQAYRNGFLTDYAHDLAAGDPNSARNNGSSGGSALSSFFGRLFYSFSDKYLLTATVRRDGSSKFASGRRWGTFPSAALAWRVSGEEFMKNVETIDNLKLRLGWGKVGNQNIPDYAFTATLRSVATPWGTGQVASNTANPDLTWETTDASNLGFDLSILKNRIEIVFDAYYKKTDNLLLSVQLPAYLGTSQDPSNDYRFQTAPWKNIGSLENKGLEIALNTRNIETKDFSWNTNLVFSLNRNKVLSLESPTGHLDVKLARGAEEQTITRTAVGQAIAQFFGYKVIGRFDSATDFYYKDASGVVRETPRPKGSSIGTSGIWIGDYIFEDISGPDGLPDGVIDENDLTYIGNPEPKFTYGFGNTFSYKNIDLSIYFNGSYGNDVFNWIRRWTDDPSESSNLNIRATGFARVEGSDFKTAHVVGGDPLMPRMTSSDANDNYRISDRFVEDGSYLRLQNISLGHTLPKKWISKIYLENVRIYANLQNVYTWTKYKGYDSEIGSMNQNALLTGIDNARYPSPRIYTAGINITF